MNKPEAHVSEAKKKEIEKLTELLKSYPVIGLVDITGLPSPQLQKMRKILKNDMVIYVSKKRLIRLALEQLKNDIKGIDKLKEHLKGMPSLILSKDGPFKLAKALKRNKSSAPAKPGQIAPNNILIQKGPTSFAPGPVISELSSVGLKTAVEGGKIAIKEDKVIAKEGDVITQKLADVLARLKIEPMEVGLNVSAILEGGVIYDRSILSVDEKQYLQNIAIAARDSFALSLSIGYTTKDNVGTLIKKAYNEARALASESKFITGDNASEILSRVEQSASNIKDKIEKRESLPKKENTKESDDITQEKGEENVKMESKEIEQDKQNEVEGQEEMEQVEAKETEEEQTLQDDKKLPENIVEETIERVKSGKIIKSELEKQQGPDEDLMRKTEDFVKQLIDNNIKDGSVDYRKRAEDKKKKEKDDKSFKEAEKKAQEVLRRL